MSDNLPTTPTPRRRFAKLRRLRATLPLLLELLLVGGFFFLDLRDLYYKIAYIGPTNNFAFYALSQRTLQTQPLVATMNISQALAMDRPPREVLGPTHRASGWPSILATCERLQPASPFFFIGALGINCRVGAGANMTVIPHLYLSSSVRADSIAWAGCKLLYRHRRPALCYDSMVAGFTQRYGFEDTEPSPHQLTAPGSAAEVEVLALLHVIAQSAPLHLTTCVEGFEFIGAGFYTTHIFGCGAPNMVASALVGVHATAFKDLHRDKAWLTVDTIDLMGFKYILRQNVKSEFPATVDAATGAIRLAPKTVTNFGSSGSLYCLMIAIDVVLMVYNLYSGVEIARLMILPLLRAHMNSTDGDLTAIGLHGVVEDYKAVLTCPLYRSRPIVLLTVATQLISWVIILPNSIIFTWSTSSELAKLQAYLSSLRLWTLLLLLFNAIWDWVVFANERLAYAISKNTYIASWEIIVIGAAVSYFRRMDLFAVTGVKYDMEQQRYTDTTSFVGTKAFGNSYDPQLDGLLSTPTSVLRTVYRPLVEIILWSLLAIYGALLVRFVVFKLWKRCKQWRQLRQTAVDKVAVTPQPVEDEQEDQLFTKRGAMTVKEDLARLPGATTVQQRSSLADRLSDDEEENGDDDDRTADTAAAAWEQQRDSEPYRRLAIEELLRIPIRALSLVRSGLEMENVASGRDGPQRYIRTPLMAEYGVVLDNNRLRVRHGFSSSALQPDIEVDKYLPPQLSTALTSIDNNHRRVIDVAKTK